MNEKKMQEVKELLDRLNDIREQKAELQERIDLQKERESKMFKPFSLNKINISRELLSCRDYLEHLQNKKNHLAGEEAKIMDQLKGPLPELEEDLRAEIDAIFEAMLEKIADSFHGISTVKPTN